MRHRRLPNPGHSSFRLLGKLRNMSLDGSASQVKLLLLCELQVGSDSWLSTLLSIRRQG